MKNNKKGLKLRQHIKNFFTKNLLIKIVSFVFAMLLWGYVLTAQNPARTKTLNDVTIIYEGQTDLLARNLVIAEGDDELQKTISVQVDTELTKYSDLSSANITATVNMKGITEAGTYELPVTVVSSAGTVRRTSITPSTVSIKVDDLITKSVPIAAQISGELPSGYWNGEPVLSKEDVSISGPAEHINAVTTAVCDIDLSGRTESFEEAKELVLIKSDGSVVSKSLLSGKVPTVGVSLEILKKATLPVDTHGAIIGADQLPSNYEMS
ncbi:MAG: hypothetical protein IJO48_07195, partial [Clostridia bacterium]|nr:hypothetical protein [Clostridia bacterium]